MKNDNFDDEMFRDMLDWLSRGMDVDGNFPEVHAPGEIVLTEVNLHFLRQLNIAISLDECERRFAN